jgi:hypothetical protein
MFRYFTADLLNCSCSDCLQATFQFIFLSLKLTIEFRFISFGCLTSEFGFFLLPLCLSHQFSPSKTQLSFLNVKVFCSLSAHVLIHPYFVSVTALSIVSFQADE